MGIILPEAPNGLLLPGKSLRVPRNRLAVSDGLRGYWPCSYDSTVITGVNTCILEDISGVGSPITLATTGSPGQVDTLTGGAITLNGGNYLSGIGINSLATVNAPFSLTCWVSVTALVGSQLILAVGDSGVGSATYLAFRSDQGGGTWCFTADGSTTFAVANAVPTVNQAYFLAGTAVANAAGGILLFVNGALQTTTGSAWGGGGNLIASTAIGASLTGGAKLAGTVYECRIHNRALDAGEVMELYQTGLRGRRDRIFSLGQWEMSALFTPPSGPTGTLAVTEPTDVAAFAGTIAITGTLATTEAADVAAFAGTGAVTGTLATTEATDVAAFAGTVSILGTLATTEAADIAAFAGSFSGVVSGTLGATEAPDAAAFAGTVTGLPVGIFAVQELPDSMIFAISYQGLPTAPSPYPSPLDYGWYNSEPNVWIDRGRPGGGTQD